MKASIRPAKTLSLAVVLAFALSAATAAAASANPFATWHWNGSVLKAGESHEITVTSGTSNLYVKALNIEIVCTADSAAKSMVIGGEPGKDSTEGVTYTGCKVDELEPHKELAVCTVKSTGEATGTIKTKALTSTLGYKPGTEEVVDAFEPVATPFTTIAIAGEECAANLKKSFPVEGSVIAKVEPQNSESTEGKLVFGVTTAKEQEIKSWEETFKGGAVVDTLTFGTHPAAYESNEIVKSTSGLGAFK